MKHRFYPHPSPLPKERGQEFWLPSPWGEGLGMRVIAISNLRQLSLCLTLDFTIGRIILPGRLMEPEWLG